ncbi:MAG: competence/damage-inducible protein A [Firmicutes bacterium]|nr:competence/damage-inducible protein A [Bacillota bacterium]
MRAELIITGTELLLGQVDNSHGQYLGRELSALGIEVIMRTVVGDNSNNLQEVFSQALKRSNMIITTGGLGPTTDDLTKETVCTLLGKELKLNEGALNSLREFFKRRGIDMPEIVIKQAYVPKGATVLPNPEGSAPGIMLEHQGVIVVMLPGPPNELHAIFEGSVRPYLAQRENKGQVTYAKIFKLTGISESAVQERLAEVGGQGNPGLAYIAKPGEVHVRISAKAPEVDQARAMVNELAERVRNRLAGYIFGTNDEVLEETVGDLLIEKGVTVGVAESCTGGLITQRLTNVAGSSRYLKGGIVAYDDATKQKLLGMLPESLDLYGAVSKECAILMAEGICRVTGAQLGLAVTGNAGPSGGYPEKPVGLTYIALAAPDGTCCREFQFPGQRWGIRWGAANAGLNMIRLYLLAQ